MHAPAAPPKILSLLIVVAIAQIIGWGTLAFPAIVGRSIAADLDISLAAVFAGNTVFYVLAGLWGPLLAKPFIRFGARRLLIVGAFLAAPGFALIAAAQGPISYFAGWAVLGTAGAAGLTTAAHILINEIAGRDARRAIGALIVVTGLSSSIFWPTTGALAAALGWRTTCLVHAALMLVVCLPLYLFGLPRQIASEQAAIEPAERSAAVPRKTTFYLVVSAITLNAFVTFGLSAVLIELLRAEGLSQAQAIAFGSVLGLIQVGARGLDFLGGRRWDGVTTGLVAGVAQTAALLWLIVGGGASWSVALFILLYGLGSGALAVARATIPLVFYDSAGYAKAASHIALPLNLVAAASPPVLAALLTGFGSAAVLGLGAACSCAAVAVLLALSQRRR